MKDTISLLEDVNQMERKKWKKVRNRIRKINAPPEPHLYRIHYEIELKWGYLHNTKTIAIIHPPTNTIALLPTNIYQPNDRYNNYYRWARSTWWINYTTEVLSNIQKGKTYPLLYHLDIHGSLKVIITEKQIEICWDNLPPEIQENTRRAID